MHKPGRRGASGMHKRGGTGHQGCPLHIIEEWASLMPGRPGLCIPDAQDSSHGEFASHGKIADSAAMRPPTFGTLVARCGDHARLAE